MNKKKAIRCEAVEVNTENGVCIGMAQVKEGESYLFSSRTPEATMCSNAFCALSNPAFIMLSGGKIRDEKDGMIERVCPHGVVKFRMKKEEIA